MTGRLAIGVGCSSRAAADDMVALMRACIAEIGPAEIEPDTILATIDTRSQMGESVAGVLGLQLVLFSAEALARVAGTTIVSAYALRAADTPSVAEASALLALGPGARLSLPRHTGRLCTCAVAVLP
jgi:cobalt-precorrin 5A hydrolase